MLPGVGQRARRYSSSAVLPMRPVVDHFRKTPVGQKQCTPQAAVELRLAGARGIWPAPLAMAPARLRGRPQPAMLPPYCRSQIIANQSAGGACIPSPSPAGRPRYPEDQMSGFLDFLKGAVAPKSADMGEGSLRDIGPGRPALTPG